MSVADGRHHLRMPEQVADHRQALAGGDGGRCKRVSQIVDAASLSPPPSAGARAERLQVG